MYADHELSRRLERTEGGAGASFVEAHAAVSPLAGACWIEVAGAYAMYDGPRSPITQSFGLGMFQPLCETGLHIIEDFFRHRGAEPAHEVCPLADRSTMPLLAERGYRPMEFTSVMFQPLPAAHSVAGSGSNIHVRLVEAEDSELWARTAAAGWRELTSYSEVMLDLMRVNAARSAAASFLAELDGRPIAAGALSIHDGVALLAGASTLPEARRQGAQLALLEARLRYATDTGCDLAMMCAEPGSASQRNAERNGFRIAYTRVKWALPPARCGS